MKEAAKQRHREAQTLLDTERLALQRSELQLRERAQEASLKQQQDMYDSMLEQQRAMQKAMADQQQIMSNLVSVLLKRLDNN